MKSLVKSIGKRLSNFRAGGESTDSHFEFGKRCEQAAAKFLKRRGMTLIQSNYLDQFGEIDLIMVDRRVVVFVEVKARRSDKGGAGYEAIDAEKERKISKTALSFLQKNDLLENAYRFDVVSILWPREQKKPTIDYFENAFESVEANQLF